MQLPTTSPLLESFENLGALTENAGLIEIKPFRDWRGTSWANKIFSMRLCNAGEIVDIDSYCNSVPEAARIQVARLEFLTRSVWAIDGHPLISDDELQKYNEVTDSELTKIQFLRGWVRNLEQIVVERLDAIYSALQLKQIRKLQGTIMCELCGGTYSVPPSNAKFVKYSLGEIICQTCCISNSDIVSTLDFEESNISSQKETASSTEPSIPEEPRSFDYTTYTCACGKELESLEEFTTHREECSKAKAL